MASELDHIFILTAPGAPEAVRLTEFGLTEGVPSTHPGQGTACRRFPFDNGYLELLWVEDRIAAESEPIRPTHLFERWTGRNDGACPFGLIFRPAADGGNGPPFAVRDYRPAWLPPQMSISLATNSSLLLEPALFYLTGGGQPVVASNSRKQTALCTAGLRAISRVDCVLTRVASLSLELQSIIDAGLVNVRIDEDYLLEIRCDGGWREHMIDFRPGLPLILRW